MAIPQGAAIPHPQDLESLKTLEHAPIEVRPRQCRQGVSEFHPPISLVFSCPACGAVLTSPTVAVPPPVTCQRCDTRVVPPQIMKLPVEGHVLRPKVSLPPKKSGLHGPLLPSRKFNHK